MTTATSGAPARHISATGQFVTLYTMQLRRLLRARKTIVLGVLQLLPVLGVLFYALFRDIDGMALFRDFTSQAVLIFMLPLAALFYGGPSVVDEIEGRTLTYMTLRPLPKPVLFLGKWAAGATIATGMMLVVVGVLFAVCLPSFPDTSSALGQLARFGAATVFGTLIYSAICASLGALFTSSIFSGVLYLILFELILAQSPEVDLLSVRYYLRAVAGLPATDRFKQFDAIYNNAPTVVPSWLAALMLSALLGATLAAGALIFRSKQYKV